jgi:hypothetical protein
VSAGRPKVRICAAAPKNVFAPGLRREAPETLGPGSFGWIALGALVLGLGAAAVLLAPWPLGFSIDARELYDELSERASAEAGTDALGWLVQAGYSYQAVCEANEGKVRFMSWLSGVLGVLMIVQTLAWLAALMVG